MHNSYSAADGRRTRPEFAQTANGNEARRLVPARDEVFVWRIDMDNTPVRREILSDDELVRIRRLRSLSERRRLAAARSALRQLLGGALGSDPRGLRFVYGPHGKPAVCTPNGGDLQFNMSHSGTIAMVAMSCGRAVGIDVERVRPDFDVEATARRWYSRAEYDGINSLPVSVRSSAFFAVWTRKEALLKARGDGLAAGLDRFTVAVPPDESTLLVAHPDDVAGTARWTLRDVPVATGYAASVAVAGSDWSLCVRNWPAQAQ